MGATSVPIQVPSIRTFTPREDNTVAAVPVSMVVWLVFNTVWFRHGRNYLIISLLMWSALATLHVSLLMSGFNYRIWLIYTLGIPGQVIILLWSNVKKKKPE